MSLAHNGAIMQEHWGSTIHWGRVVIGAVLSEAGVVAALSLVLVAHRFWIAPGRSPAEYQAFTDRASYYFAPTAAGVATFLAAFWAVRRFSSGYVVNGTLVGAVAVVLTLSFFFTAKPEHRLMYGVSFVLRIIGGYGGGLMASVLSR